MACLSICATCCFELGCGFAFVESQVPIKVGERTSYLDLLFYHVRRTASLLSN